MSFLLHDKRLLYAAKVYCRTEGAALLELRCVRLARQRQTKTRPLSVGFLCFALICLYTHYKKGPVKHEVFSVRK